MCGCLLRYEKSDVEPDFGAAIIMNEGLQASAGHSNSGMARRTLWFGCPPQEIPAVNTAVDWAAFR